jgi:rod shape-determining protein MreC
VNERFNQLLLAALLFLHLYLLAHQPETTGNRLESATLRVLGPIGHGVAGVSEGFAGFFSSFRLLGTLRRENAELRRENAELGLAVVRLRAAEEELRGRRRASQDLLSEFGESYSAEVVFIDPTSWLRVMVIYSPREVPRHNQPVLTAGGLVGRVVAPAGHYAKVLLITDRSAAVGALIERTRRQGLIEGDGASSLWLKHVPVQFDVRVGDRIVTAGVDGIFPRGVPVGQVVSVEADQGIFHRIVVQPAVDLGALESVHVLTKAAIPEEVRQQLGLASTPAPGGR